MTALRIFYEDSIKFDEKRDFPKFETDDNESWIEIEFQLTKEEFRQLKDEYKSPGNTLKVRKYFKRPVGDPAGAVPGVDVYEAGTCPGCMAMIRGALDGFKGSGKTVKNVGILSGWNVLPPERDYDLFLLVGDCWKSSPTRPGIEDYINHLKSKGATVKELPGCSPVYVFVEIGNILSDFAGA